MEGKGRPSMTVDVMSSLVFSFCLTYTRLGGEEGDNPETLTGAGKINK